jgi:hypothetical protein
MYFFPRLTPYNVLYSYICLVLGHSLVLGGRTLVQNRLPWLLSSRENLQMNILGYFEDVYSCLNIDFILISGRAFQQQIGDLCGLLSCRCPGGHAVE